MSKKILVVTDLDGTLLNERQEISEINASAIRNFINEGGLFTFATGRMEKTVIPYIQKIGLKLPIIVYNGARIYDPVTTKWLYDKTLSVPFKTWDLIESIDSIDTGVFIYQNSNVYCLNRNDVVKEYERKEKITCLNIVDEVFDKPVTKILVISNLVNLLEKLEYQITSSENLQCETVFSELNYLEILPKDVSKGNALKYLIEYLQIENLKTIAVGDNLNDLSLLSQANISYAVENAHELLKQAADKVTTDNTSHAIAQIISELDSNKQGIR